MSWGNGEDEKGVRERQAQPGANAAAVLVAPQRFAGARTRSEHSHAALYVRVSPVARTVYVLLDGANQSHRTEMAEDRSRHLKYNRGPVRSALG